MSESPFAYREGYRAIIPAEIAGPELVRLAAGRGLAGLPAEEIVEAARPEDSPLHAVFPWDDRIAADEYRLEMARRLARSICVTIVGEDGQEHRHRLFVNLNDGEGYRRIVEVKRHAPSYERLIELAVADLASAREWLSEIRGLDSIVAQIKAIERKVLRTAMAHAVD